MDTLSDLLKRIPLPGLKESNERHIIAAAVSECLGVSISARQVSVKENKIYLNTPPVLRSSIHLHQHTILALLEKRGLPGMTLT